MRVLLWFTSGFTIACAIGAYFGTFLVIGILAFMVSVGLLFLKNKIAKIAAIGLLGVAIGTVWVMGYHAIYLGNARKYDGKMVAESAVATDYSYETDFGVAVDGKIRLNGRKFSVRLYLSDNVALKPGDTISGEFRLKLTTNDSIQGQTYHQGDGIFLLGYVQEGAKIEPCRKIPVQFLPARIRHSVKQILRQVFPTDTLAFANALFLGDSSLLDYETDTDFKVSGIRHIIAVSGLHVSILLTIVFMLCGKNRYLSAVIGVPLLLLFAAVVGFTPSVMRACIMQTLMLIGMFLNKEYDPPTSLSFAVLIMLLLNPVTIVSVSFQLSIGCVIGILLFFEKINSYLLRVLRAPKGKGLRARLTRWFCSSVAITISTFITTTPLSAVYFGAISIVGVLTNLLTLWVVSFIFCGIVVTVIAGVFWAPLAGGIAWLIAWPCRYVIATAGLLAKLPMSAVYTKSVYIVIWLVSCYCLFAITVFFKKKHPVVLAISVVSLLTLAIAASWVEPRRDHYRVTVFDVGQGQSILVQYNGKYYLVDCGGDSPRLAADTVSQHLLSAGITHLDGVFVTHYDKDHAGGLPNLLTNISVGTLYLPDIADDTGIREKLANGSAEIQWITDMKRMELHGMEVALHPGKHPTNDNERSMCILFVIENYDILITGDRSAVGEKALLRAMNIPEVDTLVVGHHGSGTATSLELLEAVKPNVAVISVGRDNYYGHPADDVLYRLRLFGCSIWRTDLDGTIVFRG